MVPCGNVTRVRNEAILTLVEPDSVPKSQIDKMEDASLLYRNLIYSIHVTLYVSIELYISELRGYFYNENVIFCKIRGKNHLLSFKNFIFQFVKYNLNCARVGTKISNLTKLYRKLLGKKITLRESLDNLLTILSKNNG